MESVENGIGDAKPTFYSILMESKPPIGSCIVRSLNTADFAVTGLRLKGFRGVGRVMVGDLSNDPGGIDPIQMIERHAEGLLGGQALKNVHVVSDGHPI